MGHTMRAFLASVFLLSAVTCRPDGPGHHHGHHGAHHGAHHADHGAVHHADHGAGHHTAHGAPHHAAHGVHHATHTVGGVVSVAPHTPVHHAPVQHSVHSVVQPVSGHFSVAADPVHHAVHHAEPVHHAVNHAVHHASPVHHAVHTVDPVHSVHANTVVKTVAPAVVSSPNTVAHLVSTNPKFSTLYTAVQAAGLVDILNQPGPYTVFAPTNTAFDKIPVDQLNALLEDKEKLKSVLMRHVIPGTVMAGKNFPPRHHHHQHCC